MEYEYSINQALVRQKTLAGIEYIPLTVVIGTFGIGVFMASHGIYNVAVVLCSIGVVVYMVALYFNNVDPMFFATYIRASKYCKIYAPRPSVLKLYSVIKPEMIKRLAAIACLALVSVGTIVAVLYSVF